jgi:hypothetical protein
MLFDPFANKVRFEAFTVNSSEPCPKCGCTGVLIAPTNNTHAASSHCSKCGRFYRWLGKTELALLARQHHVTLPPVQRADAEGTTKYGTGNTNPTGNQHTETGQG